jgi:hypothetical protein
MSEIVLTGLDGSNPLGFLAALGVLNVLADRGGEPRLAWRSGDWRPVVTDATVVDREDLLARLTDDVATWHGDPCLELKYSKGGKQAKQAWDLKPPPGEFRSYLERLVATSEPQRRRAVDFAAAFATETGRDNNGNTKPTALHFTAGQQQFLEMVAQLREAITRDDLEEAVFGPWRYERALPILGWDCSSARLYALRADDPSKAEKRGVPGADWLAFRALSFIRVAPIGTQIATTGCSGGWKTGTFCWPLWEVGLTRNSVHVIVQMADLPEQPDDHRRARGICAVFACGIRRSDQGGYGSFAPAVAV